MAVHTICMVFMITSAVAQANQCPGGAESPSNDMPKGVVSLLQTKFQMNASEADAFRKPSAAKSTLSLVAQQRHSPPHVCILARTCGPQSNCKPNSDQLKGFLSSIMDQTYTDWELHLLNAQGGGEVFDADIANLQDKRVSNGPSNPEGFSMNSWGYEATNFAMKQLLSGASTEKKCSYFLFTNADNLYGHTFLETGLPGMKSGLDLLGFNFVTRYDQTPPQFGYKVLRKGPAPMQDVGFKLGHIDLGAALVSAKAIKEAQVQFEKKRERQDWLIADWDFFTDVMLRKGSKGSKVYDELLFTHQLFSHQLFSHQDPGPNADVLGPCLKTEAAGQRGDGCGAVSPSGVSWSYVMPQHTATGTVMRYLRDKLGIESCHHLHTVGHPSSVTTSFTFVANPFSRMLTNAAFKQVIGNSSFSPAHQVANFRSWVLSLEKPRICGQKAMHNYFPDVRVGHVESLAADLETVLVRLGYTLPESPIVFEAEHCITSCAENSTGPTATGNHADTTIPEGVEWYDEPTRQRVVEWFEDDFASFNFSKTPPLT